MQPDRANRAKVGVMAEAIWILIVDDHELVGQGFRALPALKLNFVVVGETADGLEAAEIVDKRFTSAMLLSQDC